MAKSSRIVPAARIVPSAPERLLRAERLMEELYGEKRHEFLDMSLIDMARGMRDVARAFSPDDDSLIACLLHRSLSSGYTLGELEQDFGADVREIVSGLHLLAHMGASDRRRSIDDLRLMLVSVSDDVRVVLLALCRQTFKVEHLSIIKDRKERERLSRESLQLYAPVAARLGIYALKHRLENAAFPVAFPVEHENISDQLQRIHARHGSFLSAAVDSVQSSLLKENAKIIVEGREKHPYSIFLKQRTKGVTDIEKIHDLFALRVLVPEETDCYQTLGLLHKFATPVSHRFKDYISFPKPNGYQSLHTCLMRVPGVPPDLQFEVQIRTKRMHDEAEYGVAAHWSYKEGSLSWAARRTQLKDVLRRQQLLFGETEKNDTRTDAGFVDHIYVLTPRGDIIELPEDATPLDFAFMVHTDLGLRFRAARVNGSIVPISHKLENGDVVEIITAKHPNPTQNWIEEVRTSSARHKLRAYFATKDRDKFLARGRDVLNAELVIRHLPPLDADLSHLREFDGAPQTIREREDLLVKIGKGAVRISTIFPHLGIDVPHSSVRQLKKMPERTSRHEHIVSVEGGLRMPLRFAKCCSPDAAVNHPPIVGFITRRGDVTVHRSACGMLRGANKEKFVKVSWINE